MIVSDVPVDQMAKTEVVASYKKLSFVEQAFRNLKTVQLEMRPIYHKKDDRIRCRVERLNDGGNNMLCHERMIDGADQRAFGCDAFQTPQSGVN